MECLVCKEFCATRNHQAFVNHIATLTALREAVIAIASLASLPRGGAEKHAAEASV
jgi:hypothetical protein